MDLSTATITILTALIGILCGAAVSSHFNLKSARKDLIFKRKLEYFEKLSKEIEENLRLHKAAVMSLSESSKKKEIEKTIEELKQKRKNFLVMSSPLYFDTRKMTERITSFVNIEKNIFTNLENLLKNHKISPAKARALFELNESLQKLNKAREASILEMREELYNK